MTITELYTDIVQGLQLALSYFVSPNKRVYWVYLISSLALAFMVFRSVKSGKSFWQFVFAKHNWWGSSPLADYGFFLFNGVIKVLFLTPLFVWGLRVSFQIKEGLLSQFGYVDAYFNETFLVIAYTVVLFVAKDFTSFLIHFAMHKIPLLWRFHKVHHSATVLNPITQYRIHPVELFFNNLSAVLCIAIVTGVFDFLYGGKLSVVAVAGVNVFNFLFLALGANLRHSHVALKYPEWLEKILISPYQHQIHHSDNQAHFDSNLGSVLAIWDKWWGTLIRSSQAKKIRFGLGAETDEFKSFWDNLIRPFKP